MKQFEPNTNKKNLKRIDWDIVKTIMKVLYHESKAKKTKIAMRSGISYENCILYLNWLEMLDMIQREFDENKSESIRLTEHGRDLYTRKLQ